MTKWFGNVLETVVRDKASRPCNSEMWWRRITVKLLVASFGSYGRRCRDELMRRRGYVPLRRLRDVPLRCGWVFHLRLSWDARKRTDGTSSLRPIETSPRHSNKTSWRRTTEMSWWRSTEMSLGVSFETYLRRLWDVQRDVVTTSSRRLVSVWVVSQ